MTLDDLARELRVIRLGDELDALGGANDHVAFRNVFASARSTQPHIMSIL